MSRTFFTLAAGGLVLAACGCTFKPPVGKVAGKVSVRSAPLTSGTIMFFPKAGGPTAQGQIQPDGTYTLTTFDPGDGAVIGTHTVMVESYVKPAKGPAREIDAETVLAVPPKYTNPGTSGLTADVKDGENTVDFNIDEKKK